MVQWQESGRKTYDDWGRHSAKSYVEADGLSRVIRDLSGKESDGPAYAHSVLIKRALNHFVTRKPGQRLQDVLEPTPSLGEWPDDKAHPNSDPVNRMIQEARSRAAQKDLGPKR